MKRTPIQIEKNPPRLADVDLDARIETEEEYAKRLARGQKRMLVTQQAYYHQKRRAILVFEGWDGAGKGSAIQRLTTGLDPRGYKVWPISAPTKEEQGRHYLYRFWQRLPEPGTIAVFDRSWYGRVLVERVEGFATKEQWSRAYDEINEFERLLIDDGARIIKIFIHVSKDEQARRFEKRLNDPLKRWKITLEDMRNRQRWTEYEDVYGDMLERTSTKAAPWHLISGEHKWHTRLAVIDTVTKALADGVSLDPPELDPEVAKAVIDGLKL
ncbi:polyphosphate kinase 2 family protein [Zavarzinia sp. CC-PAN008]|uniref:polyphosphate kinase 2 family protein n=1 Tax=Zavarzinia sp. CC-PAN008 TaxID=3243332 RepID=UPI003F74951B